ncbi:fermentation/respiration switch protein [compost metagenome]
MKTSKSNVFNKRRVTDKLKLNNLVRKGFLISALAFGTVIFTAQATFAVEVKTKISSEMNQKNIRHVTFKNGQIIMAGDLYLPDNFNEKKQYPTIIVAHPGGGVKEQTASLYAQKLSKKGFITLAFDASHQGESGGEPRFLENPAERVEDFRSSVDYLTTLNFVDKDRIAVLGICAGGGYGINAAMTEHRIKAVGTVSAFDIGLGFRKGWYGDGTLSDQLKLLDEVAKQRTLEANGAKPLYINYVPEKIDANTPRDLRQAYEYYRTPRGQHKNSGNQLLFSSVDKIIAFDATDNIQELLTQPLLLIAGSDAESLWHSKHFYDLAKSKKELFLVDHATHMTMYDQPDHVNKAVEKLASFYNANL